MDHSMHGTTMDMGDMPMRCKMSMVWNTEPHGICLVFPFLQIQRSTSSLIFWLSFLALLSVFFEWSRLYAGSLDRQLRSTLRGAGGNLAAAGAAVGTSTPRSGQARRPSSALGDASEEALLGGRSRQAWGSVRLPVSIQTRRSLLYTLNLAISFYLMLIIMTYNAQCIGAVLFGAFVGHFIFQRNFDLAAGGGEDDGKGLSCH
ncbi:Ctr copper transporter family-domain-containing protein [Leucosporidium creatinivorum]|uniref:Copper transport protein n=1 Tax=Leucosporidium creatinivorum TaxID=106004 RepID=A0A1Y2FL50_9BASI|nr:Ctr copper transporter family-domain-containing protein [Leucosporidium creatinivorum]